MAQIWNIYTPYNYKKTGKTKNILGYSCDEYLVEDEATEVHMWVSEKLGKQVRREMLRAAKTRLAMSSKANGSGNIPCSPCVAHRLQT